MLVSALQWAVYCGEAVATADQTILDKQDLFIDFLSRYIDLTIEEEAHIRQLDMIRQYDKNTILLREGEIANCCYAVLKGCIRSYYLTDGEEKTTAFFVESQVATPISYSTGQPSGYYMSCLEDVVLCVGYKEKTDELVRIIPRLASIGHLLNSAAVVEYQIQFDAYKTLTPEKRYLKLLDERPDLCQRVPQYHLASYLGIKPESLSRIRRRILQQG